MKLYVVEIKSTAVVLAKDKAHARMVALDHRDEIVCDDAAVEVGREVMTPADLSGLPDGFDADYVPFGTNDLDDSAIGEILEP